MTPASPKPRPRPGRPRQTDSPTMRDVAKHAGVGIATISRVINRSPLVTAEKAEKIFQAMQDVGYKASPISRRSGRRKKGASELTHGAVCMLLIGRWISTSAPVYAYVLEGAEAALRLRDVNCMIRSIHTVSDLGSLKNMQVDGFLILGAGNWSEWPAFLHPYPAVSVLGSPASGWGDCVTYNNWSTGKLAADYLLARGVRHAAIMGYEGQEIFGTRRETFTRTMIAGGATVHDLSSAALPDVNLPNDHAIGDCFKEFMRLSPRLDGLFATSDVIAPAVYRELERLKLVPGTDLQVVSCNNEKSYLTQLKTPPAVVDIQSGLIGMQAVEGLFWRLQNPDAPRRSVLIEPTLVIPPA